MRNITHGGEGGHGTLPIFAALFKNTRLCHTFTMSPSKKKRVRSLRCPTCATIVLKSDEDFPFCSDRCRKIDLGKWASGGYRISSPIVDPSVLEDLENAQQRIDAEKKPN